MSFVDKIIPGQYNTIYEHVKLKNVALGDFTYVSKNSEIMNAKIGKFCSISSGCRIGLGTHPVNFVSTHPIFYSVRGQAQLSFSDKSMQDEYKEIIIGHDVWIGTNVIIIDGVKIGNGAIIAAGSTVTKDIPAYAIVGGVPAKIIRYRFSKSDCENLESFKWWDKDVF